jgi:DegV family protein with EDD domain
MKIAIVTDSTAYIPQEIREKLNIHMIPLNVIFGDVSYREEVEISAEQFYKKVREQEELPKTSQPAIGEFVELYEQLSKEYDQIVSIHISSGISGAYQGAITAGELVEAANVFAFDTELTCGPQAFYTIEAAEMAAEGKSAEEIIARLEEMKKTVNAYFMVEDLNHLQRGGRLSSAQAFIGSLLQVKPILTFIDTKIEPFDKVRTRKRAIKRIVELFEEVANEGKPMKAVVIHANQLEEAEEMKATIEARYPQVEVSLSYFGPVIGTHLGEGSLGLGWYVK